MQTIVCSATCSTNSFSNIPAVLWRQQYQGRGLKQRMNHHGHASVFIFNFSPWPVSRRWWRRYLRGWNQPLSGLFCWSRLYWPTPAPVVGGFFWTPAIHTRNNRFYTVSKKVIEGLTCSNREESTVFWENTQTPRLLLYISLCSDSWVPTVLVTGRLHWQSTSALFEHNAAAPLKNSTLIKVTTWKNP